MFDNVKLQTNIIAPIEVRNCIEKPFESWGLKFVPKYNIQNGKFNGYRAKWENLYIELIGDYISISNSLQKFYHKNSYGDFFRSEIEDCMFQISDRFNVNPKDWRAKTIEVGLNIKTNEVADNYLEQFETHRGNNFIPMLPKKGTIKSIGIICPHADYSIKGYDKILEVRNNQGIEVQGNLLRLEITTNNIDVFKYLATGDSLFNPEYLRKAGDFLFETYKRILWKEKVNYNNFDYGKIKKVSELKIIAAWQNPAIRSAIKKGFKETYKKDHRKYETLTMGLENDLKGELEIKIKEEINRLVEL